MAPSKLILALLCASAPATAQDNMSGAPGPGTSHPQGYTCGLPQTTTLSQYQFFIEGHYREVLALAKRYYADKKNPRQDGEGLGEVKYDPADEGGSAHARAPDIISIKPAICGEFPNADQLAWVIGHEIAHLAMKHGETKIAAQEKLKASCPDEACVAAGLSKISKPQESAADARSLDYLKLSQGIYNLENAAKGPVTIQDLYWVEGKDAGPRPFHPTARQRKVELDDKLRNLQAAEPAKAGP